MEILILHGEIPADAALDEQDTLEQVAAVKAALEECGHGVKVRAVDLNLSLLSTDLKQRKPDLVFNLIETFGGTLRLSHVVPLLLEQYEIPFTGCSSSAIALTTDKVSTKALLREQGLKTLPSIVSGSEIDATLLEAHSRWIVKTRFEDGSIGLDDSCVLSAPTKEAIQQAILNLERKLRTPCFAEPYIEGREINVSLMQQGKEAARVLGVSEIEFNDYKTNKPRIIGYAAKWLKNSFEYAHTVPKILSVDADLALIRILSHLSGTIWRACQLRSYARVDYRVDEAGIPWVLEVNANPCVAKDAGFVRAALSTGLTYTELIEQLVMEAHAH